MFQSLVRLTKHSAIYGIGHVLSRSVVLFLLPLHTNFISKMEYGIATQLFAFLAIMAIVYSYGLNTAFLQFYLLEDNKKKKKEIFSTAFFTTAISSIFLSLIFLVSAGLISRLLFHSAEYAHLIRISAGILAFDALLLLSFNILRAMEKSVHFVSINLASMVVNLFFNIYFIGWCKMGVDGIFYANLISSAISFSLLIPVAVHHLSFVFSKQKLAEMLKFGLPFIPSTFSIVLINVIDRFFINKYIGLEAAGIYGVGYKLALFMNLFITAFRFAWQPFFVSTAKQEDAKQIFSRIFTYFTLICSLIFLIFLMFVDQLVQLDIFGFTIFGKAFWDSTNIVPVIVLAYVFYGFYLNFQVGIYLKEKTKYLMYINIFGAAVNVIGNILLIPGFKLMGAAYATLFSYLVMTLLIFYAAQRIYNIKYEFGRIFRIVIFTVIIYFIFNIFELQFETLVKIILVLVYLLFLYLSGFFEKREIEKLKSILKKYSWQN